MLETGIYTNTATKELLQIFGNHYFDFPKPVGLIKNLLIQLTEQEDIILNFFSGSATTAHVVMQLNAEDGGNRRFIMVQLPEAIDEKSEANNAGYNNICEIGKERIRRAGTRLIDQLTSSGLDNGSGFGDGYGGTGDGGGFGDGRFGKVDVGFRVLKLDSSNLHAWDCTPISDGNLQTLWDRFDAREKTVKHDRADLDIVFEVMLKMGINLDYSVSEITVGGRKCYSIGEKPYEDKSNCYILVCLDFGITPEDITAFCNLAPAKIVAA